MFQLVAPQSMKTGCACSYNTGLALALNVNVEQSTSSPGCTPTKRNARWIAAVPGIEFMPRQTHGSGNHWLTCITIDPSEFGATREEVRLMLEAHNVEARPVWKPLHMQPVFAGYRVRGGERSAAVFERGLCLPSGSNLSRADLERISTLILAARQSVAATAL